LVPVLMYVKVLADGTVAIVVDVVLKLPEAKVLITPRTDIVPPTKNP
jgi:hypothetical protein